MNKDWLIAHRGAQCDGHENTKAAFEACQNYPLDWVELDLHTTSDSVVICHHDFDINGSEIKTHSYQQLKAIDPELTTFDEAIRAVNNSAPLIVEIKAADTVQHILKQLIDHLDWRVASYQYSVLEEIAQLGIDKKRLFLLQHKVPFLHLYRAKRGGFGGIAIHKFYLWPIFLWRAHRSGLQIYVHSVNSLGCTKYIRKFYPYVGICTNQPDRLQKLK